MSRIAHLTSAHPPDDVRIFHKQVRSLREAGHEVRLIAGRAPGGRFARMTWTVTGVLRDALEARAEIYHFHDPELIPAGLLLKIVGKKVVYDAHEDLPKQILSKPWIPTRLRRPVAFVSDLVERGASRFFDQVVAATPSIASRFDPAKTVTVRNFPLAIEAPTEPAPYSHRPPLIAYVGSITRERGIVDLIDAMEDLPAHRLALAGRFSPASLKAECEARPGWRNVDLQGWASRPEVAHLLARARVAVIPFRSEPNHEQALPTKLFEAMAAGAPVVCSNLPAMRSIVEEAGCGSYFEPGNSRSLAQALLGILEDPAAGEAMGARGRRAFETSFRWEGEAAKLLALYRDL